MLRTIFYNTGSNLLVMVIKLAITFIMTPIFVRSLGNYDYGIWEILGAIVGYMGLLDLGIKPAISRFAAKYKAEKGSDNLRLLYSSAFLFMGVIGLLIMSFFVLWGVFFPGLIAENSTDTQRYTLLLIILGVQLLITFPAFVAESFFEGFQKYYLKNNITIFNSIVGSLILYFFITPTNGLILLAGVNAIGFSIKYIILMWLLSRPAYGGIKLDFSYFSFEQLKEILSFGLKSFVQGVSTRIENATDSLVIGFFLGPALVPIYSIPANLVNYIRTFGWTLTHAFMPLFSQLDALNEREKIRQVYFTASRYVISLIFPIGAGVCLVGSSFIGLWIGPEFAESADLLILLLVLFTAFPFVNPFSNRFLTAIGKHGIFAKLTPISALLNLVLSVLLVQDFGILGVVMGSVIPIFIFVPVYLLYTCKQLEVSVWDYLRQCIFPVLFPTLVMSMAVLVYRLEWGMESYSKIAGAVVVGVLVYFPLFWLLTLKKAERGFIYSRLRRA